MPRRASCSTEVNCRLEDSLRNRFCRGCVLWSEPNRISPRAIISRSVSGVLENPLGGTGHGLPVSGWISGSKNLASVLGSGARRLTLVYTRPASSRYRYARSPPLRASFRRIQSANCSRARAIDEGCFRTNSFAWSRMD